MIWEGQSLLAASNIRNRAIYFISLSTANESIFPTHHKCVWELLILKPMLALGTLYSKWITYSVNCDDKLDLFLFVLRLINFTFKLEDDPEFNYGRIALVQLPYSGIKSALTEPVSFLMIPASTWSWAWTTWRSPPLGSLNELFKILIKLTGSIPFRNLAHSACTDL